MNIAKGNIVIATAGKEKGQKFVVLSCDSKYCYLVDGKRLKLSKPKKKSLKHVQKASKIDLISKNLSLGSKMLTRKSEKF